MSTLKVLIIDDHPFIIEGYKTIISNHAQDKYKLNIIAANSGNQIEAMYADKRRRSHVQLALVDINIPKSDSGLISSGKDAAIFIKKQHPKIKIIVLTMHNDDGRIREILTDLNPEGFLVKSDLSSEELTQAFDDVLCGEVYYSSTIRDHFKRVQQNDFELDKKNLKILHLLSQGVRTKNLPDHLGMSLSAVEKRKNHMKSLFNLHKANDDLLLSQARKKGFV